MTDWFFFCRPRRNVPGWIALAKREPFTADGDSILEPGELWLDFGDTEEEALANIRADVAELSEQAGPSHG